MLLRSNRSQASTQELRDMGELSTKLLAETKIGLAVNQLSKVHMFVKQLKQRASTSYKWS